MVNRTVLTKRKGKKVTSVFNCRKGKHYWVTTGTFEDESSKIEFRWCYCCGCLEERKTDATGNTTTKIITPDKGI